MGKNKNNDGLSKAERKALEQREADLMAELEARAAETKSKGKSKAKAKSTEPDLTTLKRKGLKALIADKTNGKTLRKAAKAELQRRDAIDDAAIDARHAEVDTLSATPRDKVLEAAESVLESESSDAAREAAETAREAALEADDTETDEQIKARIKAKREAREAEAARAAKPVKPARTKVVTGESGKPVAPDEPGSARKSDALPGESEVDYQWRKRRENDEAAAAKNAEAIAAKADENPAPKSKSKGKAAKAEPEQVAEVVETETGREFAVGPVDEGSEFGKPSEAPRDDFETNGNGQYKVKRPSDGKIVGYTRVTTFIGTNEDRTLIEQWKARVLLEGVALNDTPDERGEYRADPVVVRVRELLHRRDVAIAKARKADRKGKLAPGQFATITDAAWSEFKRDLNALAEDMLELGGAHEKAAKGTQLHELFELYDREGIDAVGELVVEGKITHADLADVEAYARAIEAAGIKIIPEYIEAPVVIHDEKIAGRLDRVVMARLPGAARASRYVLDVKSGRIDLGAGKIAQQLEKYAKATPYNLDTHETLEPHKASTTKALVLHLTPGSAKAAIHVVDLGAGRVGNDLSAKVRAFRNDGKRAIDLTVDLAAQSGGAA